MNALLTVSSFIFPVITFPYVSRVLGPEGYGRVGFATSLITYFSMFAKLGIPTYGIRACAQVRDDREKLSRTVQELLVINLVMSAITYAAFLACGTGALMFKHANSSGFWVTVSMSNMNVNQGIRAVGGASTVAGFTGAVITCILYALHII